MGAFRERGGRPEQLAGVGRYQWRCGPLAVLRRNVAHHAAARDNAKTWSQILSDYPGIKVRLTNSQIAMRVGEPYADGYTENIDTFTFGTGAGTTIFDFEKADDDADGLEDVLDNCPTVYNPGQENVNGEPMLLPKPFPTNDDATNPAGDSDGNACDSDIDGDGVANGAETLAGLSPYIWDTDGDRTNDGTELLVRLQSAQRGEQPHGAEPGQ